jgi:hypothetical protein
MAKNIQKDAQTSLAHIEPEIKSTRQHFFSPRRWEKTKAVGHRKAFCGASVK